MRWNRLLPVRAVAAPAARPALAVAAVAIRAVHGVALLSHLKTHDLALHYTRRVTTEALVDNHRKFLAFVEKRVGDRALAEDILQDAFVKSLEKQDEIRDDASSVAWFYQLLRNSIIDQYRRRATRPKALEALAVALKDAVEPPPEPP